MRYTLYPVRLSQFDGEGAGAAAEAAAEAPAQETQAAAAEPQGEDKKAREKAYRDYVNGDMKDLYQADVQAKLNRRFAEHAALEKQVQDVAPLLDKLEARYGTREVGKILEAVDKDSGYWERLAEDSGSSPEQLRAQKELEVKYNAMLRAEEARLGRERAERQYGHWLQEAEAVKAQYPDFDLETEQYNPQFIAMLRSGVPMQNAYMVLHQKEILRAAVQATAVETEKRVVDNVRAKGTRPAENGTTPHSAFTTGVDVAKLNREQRAEYVARAAQGERITFSPQ